MHSRQQATPLLCTPHIRSHLLCALPCSIQEQRSSVAVLLAGTSGTGKSTLAGLLAARLGITTVLSTDNIRHMLRSFAAEEQNPLLWASTYQVPAYLLHWHAFDVRQKSLCC